MLIFSLLFSFFFYYYGGYIDRNNGGDELMKRVIELQQIGVKPIFLWTQIFYLLINYWIL